MGACVSPGTPSIAFGSRTPCQCTAVSSGRRFSSSTRSRSPCLKRSSVPVTVPPYVHTAVCGHASPTSVASAGSARMTRAFAAATRGSRVSPAAAPAICRNSLRLTSFLFKISVLSRLRRATARLHHRAEAARRPYRRAERLEQEAVKAQIRGRIGLLEHDAADEHNGRWKQQNLMLIGVRLVGRESRRLCVVNAEGRGRLADGFARGTGRFIRQERFAAARSC